MNEKVSIIIPVYNVEEYIDRCLESVVKQTYKNLEIIIMEAQSEDNSLQKVKKWKEIDSRITIVSKKDKGLGDARNNAIKMACADYIIFLDSDDWLDFDFVEKTMTVAISHSNVDIVMADARKYVDDSVVDMIGPEWTKDIYETEEDKKKLICFGSNFIWGKLFKKSLFQENNIVQPNLPFEDLAVYAMLISSAKKIATCHSTYTNYQADRENSLSSFRETYKKLPEVYNWAEKGLRQTGKYETYEKAFKLSMYIHSRIICIYCVGRKKFAALEETCPEISDFFQKYFPEFMKLSYMVYGGFTLRWIASEISNGLDGIKKHITFTTIIAQMSRGKNQKEIVHDNIFRERCVNDDINGYFLCKLKTSPSEILFIDFTQECIDILSDMKGNYITVSEALSECGIEKGTDCDDYSYYKRISWSSEEYWDLWKKKCKEFIKKIEESNIKKVFLIKNRYAATFKKDKRDYTYLYGVEQKNLILEKMYDFFEKECKSCVICNVDNKLLYTDMTGKLYSPRPDYMNISFYRREAIRIQSDIYSDYLR